MVKNLKNKLAASYAQAWFSAAKDEQKEDKVWRDVKILTTAIKEDASIIKKLSNPLWENKIKKEAIKEIGKYLDLQEVSVHALNEITDHNRLYLLSEILSHFNKIYYAANNIEEVFVTSALKLTPTQDEKLRQVLEQNLNKKVVIKYIIKPEILGGLLIEYGSVMLDDTLKGKLKKLELLMKGTK